MPSGRDYANRLLEETHRTLAPHLSGLQDALQNLSSHLTTSLEQLAPKLETFKTVEIAAAGNIFSEAIEEVHRQKQQEIAFLADFSRDLRKKETQEEILTHLLDAAHRYAPRVALFAVRDKSFAGWSSRGYSNEIAEKIQESSIDISASPVLSRAAGAGEVITLPELTGESLLLQYLPGEQPGPCHFLPMKAMNRNVAVLLAADNGDQHCEVSALQVLVDLTALYTETLALQVLSEMKPEETSPPGPEPAITAPPVEPALPALQVEPLAAASVESLAEAPQLEPVEPPTQTVESTQPVVEIEPELAPEPHLPAATEIHERAVEAAPEPVVEEPPAESKAPAVAPAEPIAEVPASIQPTPSQTDVDREVDALLEAIGRPAPGVDHPVIDLSKQAAAPLAHLPEPQVPTQTAEAKAASEEERVHADARRFARLLVSEIKLYNEQRLVEGREHKDIYVRLKRDIDKSRDMYQRRVPKHVSRKFDYFSDEVVRILAENDPTKLGSDYPGPRVES